jgi:hypothetical protein
VSRILDEIETFLELQGLVKGTKAYNVELRKEKVARCMQMQDVQSCTECARFVDCDIRLAYWRDVALGPESANEQTTNTMETPEGDIDEEDY